MKLVVGDIHIICRIYLMDIFCLLWQQHICGWGEGPVSSVNLLRQRKMSTYIYPYYLTYLYQ